ncbi:YtxH domain-containing protein [Rossellomorea vietnamensis]|uniref:YtxH domain-containing protein n=2 Tax=Rossellomorea TaxID=2837508 RepID=A0A5D4KJG5_9BACI|nr:MULTISPECIES: YtxH domain-containing protein [Rossellomorea]TYR77000.1 YtxH domain-containing protein [Rossellomorea vietnamensis]TYS84217.1 YtxH domain-containing protein [Rossellomorea aquimaris]
MTQQNDVYKNQVSHGHPNGGTNNNNNATHEGSINAKDFLIGSLIGGIVGAATALFLAPKSGKELRDDLNTHAGTLKEKSGQWRETAMERGNELASAAKEKTSGITKTVQEQSTNLVNKVKSGKNEDSSEVTGEEQLPVETEQNDAQELNQKLEETKKAFDDTEQTIKQ